MLDPGGAHGNASLLAAWSERLGGSLSKPTTLGYLFSIDRGAIRVLDLNGGERTIFAPALRASARRSARLPIFWDRRAPSESAKALCFSAIVAGPPRG